jgi:hypothetical protein
VVPGGVASLVGVAMAARVSVGGLVTAAVCRFFSMASKKSSYNCFVLMLPSLRTTV